MITTYFFRSDKDGDIKIIPQLPRQLLWDDKESVDDFRYDPFKKEIFTLLKENGNIRSIMAAPYIKILNEVFYQCTKIVYLNNSTLDMEALELDIKANIGLKLDSKWVIRLIYAILASRKNNTEAITKFMENFDMFNFMMKGNNSYYKYIRKVSHPRNKFVIDLSPNPCPIDKLSAYPILWKDVTYNYNEDVIKDVLELWTNPKDKLYVLDIIEKESRDNITHINEEDGSLIIVGSNCDFSKLRKELLDYTAGYYNSTPPLPNEDNSSEVLSLKQEIEKLLNLNKKLQTEFERQRSELNSQKKKENQERSFTLSMIIDYCKNNTNMITGPIIIAMLNRFLRDFGNSTKEECNMVDQAEHYILNKQFVGNTINNPMISFQNPYFAGAMYDVRDNGNVNIGKAGNGEEE